jgi:hypothetical protein
MDTQKNPHLSIRELMPEGYTVELSRRTGCKNLSNLSQIVRLEHSVSKYWPAVLQLAEESNPEGFATWAATNPEMVPARTGNPSPVKIRDLMPQGFLERLMNSTGSKSYSGLAHIVRDQHYTSSFWPAVLQLAEETNPEGFAAWAAANPDMVPARAAA